MSGRRSGICRGGGNGRASGHGPGRGVVVSVSESAIYYTIGKSSTRKEWQTKETPTQTSSSARDRPLRPFSALHPYRHPTASHLSTNPSPDRCPTSVLLPRAVYHRSSSPPLDAAAHRSVVRPFDRADDGPFPCRARAICRILVRCRGVTWRWGCDDAVSVDNVYLHTIMSRPCACFRHSAGARLFFGLAGCPLSASSKGGDPSSDSFIHSTAHPRSPTPRSTHQPAIHTEHHVFLRLRCRPARTQERRRRGRGYRRLHLGHRGVR